MPALSPYPISSPAQPAPLGLGTYTTWPGGVDPTARLFNTDNTKIPCVGTYAGAGGSRKASRKNLKASRKNLKASRKNRKASRKNLKASRKNRKASRKNRKASRKNRKANRKNSRKNRRCGY